MFADNASTLMSFDIVVQAERHLDGLIVVMCFTYRPEEAFAC